MLAYRFGRLLQLLALIDCAFALFFSHLIPRLGGMDSQFQIVLFAALLFFAGRYFQKKGETALRASGRIPPADTSEGGTAPTADGGENP